VSPTPPGPGAIRLRRALGAGLDVAALPADFTQRTLMPEDGPALHALLVEALDEKLPFQEWWQTRSRDAEFDAALCLLVFDRTDRLVAAAFCWTSAFVKDLVVHPSVRRLGIGEALLTHVFATFRARGAAHVDLKTNRIENADAVRLYTRLGMVEVDWEG
jgi:ribosomal protein S18 acetylase RimI-like enzyme